MVFWLETKPSGVLWKVCEEQQEPTLWVPGAVSPLHRLAPSPSLPWTGLPIWFWL